MGRALRHASNALCSFILVGLALLAGCAWAPSAVRDDPSDPRGEAPTEVRALRGIATPATPRLADLGDIGLLDSDSAMRDALVGGDAEVVVAATMCGSTDMFALDLVVLNRRDEVLELRRADLQVVDANGHWLEPVTAWAEGDRHGFSGRRGERARSVVTYEVDQDREANSARLMQNLETDWGSTSSAAKRPVSTSPPPRPRVTDTVVRSPGETLEAPTGAPVRAAIPPADGSVFWGYFRAVEPTFPLTAVVLIDGEQVLFRFDR